MSEILLTKEQAGKYLKVSKSTIEKYIRNDLPTRKMGRYVFISPHDIKSWLAKKQTPMNVCQINTWTRLTNGYGIEIEEIWQKNLFNLLKKHYENVILEYRPIKNGPRIDIFVDGSPIKIIETKANTSDELALQALVQLKRYAKLFDRPTELYFYGSDRSCLSEMAQRIFRLFGIKEYGISPDNELIEYNFQKKTTTYLYPMCRRRKIRWNRKFLAAKNEDKQCPI